MSATNKSAAPVLSGSGTSLAQLGGRSSKQTKLAIVRAQDKCTVFSRDHCIEVIVTNKLGWEPTAVTTRSRLPARLPADPTSFETHLVPMRWANVVKRLIEANQYSATEYVPLNDGGQK
jgi:hypothetical protein